MSRFLRWLLRRGRRRRPAASETRRLDSTPAPEPVTGEAEDPGPVPESPSPPIQLQKYLAASGVASRREAERMVAEGRVRVNGAVAAPGAVVNPATDEVAVDGEVIHRDRKVYLALYKPVGVISSTEETEDRQTLMDCLADVDARVFPVGRLDKDAEGLLLMTNDGELAYRLTQPDCSVERVYIVRVEGALTEETVAALRTGVRLDDAIATAKVTILDPGLGATLIRMALVEDRKRKVRPLCMAVGHPVCEMRRIAIGNIYVEDLKPGEWRFLSKQEVSELMRLCDA